MAMAIARYMEPWWPPQAPRCLVKNDLFGVSDLFAILHCVMFWDVALGAIRYWGGVCPHLGRGAFPSYPTSTPQQNAELLVIDRYTRMAL